MSEIVTCIRTTGVEPVSEGKGGVSGNSSWEGGDRSSEM